MSQLSGISGDVLSEILCALSTDTKDGTVTSAAQLLQVAISHVEEGIVVVDLLAKDQVIIFINEGFTRLTGYTADDVLGKNCRFLQGPETDRNTVARIHSSIVKGVPFKGELLNYKKNGEVFCNYLSLTPVSTSTGSPSHYIGVQYDLTSQRLLEKELALAQSQIRKGGPSTSEHAFQQPMSQTPMTLALDRALVDARTSMTSRSQVAAREYTNVSLLQGELLGFTDYVMSVSPQELVLVLNHVWSNFDEIVSKHGLEKIKTVGDEFIISGGLPVLLERPCTATYHAAKEMVTFINKYKSPSGQQFHLRLGAHVGNLVAGVVGAANYGFDVWGDNVKISHKALRYSSPDHLNCTKAFFEGIKKEGMTIAPGQPSEIKLRNAKEPVETMALKLVE